MSVRAMNWACEMVEQEPQISPKSALVLYQLAWFHNQETGRCDPSISKIMKRTRLSKNSVLSAIKELEFLRLVKTIQRKVRTENGVRNLPNRYQFNRLGGSAAREPGVVHQLDSKGHKEALRGRRTKEPSAYDDLVKIIDLDDEAY